MPESLLFYVLSGLAVGASALVIGQRNPMYSVLLLIVSFAALAGLYITLDAPFVAMAQMIIYAGAIMVLFLFVVMLLNAPQEDAAGWDRVGGPSARAVQGNLDPSALLAPWDVVEREALDVLARAGGRDGHVFNLGHGVLPDTPVETLQRLVDLVHERTARGGAS